MLAPIHPAVDRRARWLLRILVLWGIVVLARLFYLQIIRHDFYADLAESQQTRLVEIAAHRGTIYDRNGHILAITVPIAGVVLNPQQVPNLEIAASILSQILGIPESDLLNNLRAKAVAKRKYFKVADRITQDQVMRLKSLRLGWIQFESSTIRVYPNDQLAAHVLGGVDFEMQGNGGIEQGLEDDLAGRAVAGSGTGDNGATATESVAACICVESRRQYAIGSVLSCAGLERGPLHDIT